VRHRKAGSAGLAYPPGDSGDEVDDDGATWLADRLLKWTAS